MHLPEDVVQLFPPGISEKLRAWKHVGTAMPEELRCRVGQPVFVLMEGQAKPVEMPGLTAGQLDHILERAAKASIHAHAEELRRGFLHTSSGCRVGVCGTVYYRGGEIAGIREISSLSIRIPHAVKGCADKVFAQLTKYGFHNTLILSAPGCGKTTLLRDLIRLLSNSGLRLSVADERGELAAMHGRKPGFDLGANTDVMSGGRKGESAMMLLRAMNPQVLAFDEITSPEDLEVVAQAAGCGTALLAAAHAADRASLERRALYRELLASGVFETAVWIHLVNGRRIYQVEALMR